VPGMSALEGLLVDRIITCWLDLNLAELAMASNRGNRPASQLEHHEKRRDRAHQRFVSSILALARTRRLLISVVNIAPAGAPQVNVARRGATQFNMTAGGGGSADSGLPGAAIVEAEGMWREDPGLR